MNTDTPSKGVFEQRFKDWFFDDTDPRVVFKSERHGMYVRLDDKPVTPGHSLAIPLEGQRYIDDLSETRSNKLWTVSRHVGRHIMEAYQDQEPRYVGVLVAGAAVHHAHIHRAVCFEGRDWIGGFDGQPRLELTDDEWANVYDRTTFTPEQSRALEAELDRIAPPEDIVAQEIAAYEAARS